MVRTAVRLEPFIFLTLLGSAEFEVAGNDYLFCAFALMECACEEALPTEDFMPNRNQLSLMIMYCKSNNNNMSTYFYRSSITHLPAK